MLIIMPLPVFIREPLYPYYETAPRLWRMTALEDQITGWVLMGLFDVVVYGIAFFVLLARMLDYEERLTRRREAITLTPKDSPQ